MKRHALVIGINEWDDKRFRPLKCAEKDAREVAIQLGRLDFQTIRLLQRGEAALPKVVSELRELSNGLTPEDLLFVYFAGHGTTGNDGHNYLLCWDALRDSLNADEQVGCLSLHGLVKLMRQQGTFNRLIITDACRDDLDAGRAGGEVRFKGAGSYRNLGRCQVTEKVGHVLLNSCEDQKRALELDAHGLFTADLLQLWEEKRTLGEPLWMNAAFRDQLGARMQDLAQANRLPRDEQWPLFVEGRRLPFPLDGTPASPASSTGDKTPASALAAPLPTGTSPAAHQKRWLQKPVLQENEFCGVCGKHILTTLDVAGRCQYGGCAQRVCNACWVQQQRVCREHRRT